MKIFRRALPEPGCDCLIVDWFPDCLHITIASYLPLMRIFRQPLLEPGCQPLSGWGLSLSWSYKSKAKSSLSSSLLLKSFLITYFKIPPKKLNKFVLSPHHQHNSHTHHHCHRNHRHHQVLYQARKMGRGQSLSSLWYGRQLQGKRSQVWHIIIIVITTVIIIITTVIIKYSGAATGTAIASMNVVVVSSSSLDHNHCH